MPKIIPVRDLKNTTRVSELCHETGEPIFITKNGYGDMVLMSMETFEAFYNAMEIYKHIAISEQEFADGESKDARTSLRDLRAKYGL